MIKLGANSVLFSGFDLGVAFKQIAQAGYDGIELSAIKGMCEHLDLDNFKEQISQIRGLSQEYGLDLLAIEEAALDEQRLLKAYEAASELNIPVINVGPGGKSDVEEDFQRQLALLAKMADRAHEFGVTLCAKAHIGQCIHDTPTTLRAMEAIDSPGFGVDMDPSHVFRAGEDPVEALQAVIGRVAHVHIRDCLSPTDPGPGKPELQACGRGGIDLFGYVGVLHESGLDVSANLEVIGAGDYELPQVATIAAESYGYLNACLRLAGGR